MPDDETEAQLPTSRKTVTPLSQPHRNEEMDVVGWAIAIGMLVLLLPLLPFVVFIWLLSKIAEQLSPGR